MHPACIAKSGVTNNTFHPDVKRKLKNIFHGTYNIPIQKGFPSAITETPFHDVISSTNSSIGPPRQTLPRSSIRMKATPGVRPAISAAFAGPRMKKEVA
jgi:hypothetical protein